MKMKHASVSSVLASALLMLATPACMAQAEPVSKTNPDFSAKASIGYWTAERFKAARPLPMPHAAPGTPASEDETLRAETPEFRDGAAPTQSMRVTAKRLFAPDEQAAVSDVVEPGAVGTFGAHYTSTRVFPMFTGSAAPFSADRSYPYTTVGKLFFSINGAPYVCSASVIQRRVVATAGHCVHSGTSSGFYSNWVFVPAFRDGTAPFLSWNWRYVIVTGTWAGGGGGVPNAADYAMIEFGDQPLSSGAPPSKLGNVTGWLGWQTLSLSTNHTSKLGYPCNLDSCQKMQDVMSNSFRNTSPNNVEYGSDAGGGSSGGPWVQNFQVLASGGGTGSNTGSNRVVGVTSYGYTSTDPKVQGASIPDNRWVQLFNTICARSGNCN
jgi:V8-like Glu-specific endopeptidase